MPEIDADYLGGDPSQLDPHKGGRLAAAAGSLTFSVTVMSNALTTQQASHAAQGGDPGYLRR